MSDEAREAQVNENQNRLAESRRTDHETRSKSENHRGKKIPRKSPLGKSLAEKNRQAKAALDREVKREREIAEKEQENENSPGWLPEMSFQTVLSIVGMTFTAIELYQRFHQKDSSAGVSKAGDLARCQRSPEQNQIHSGAPSGAPSRTQKRSGARKSPSERSSDPREAPSVQNSEWFERSTDQRFELIIIYFFLPLKCQNRIN